MVVFLRGIPTVRQMKANLKAYRPLLPELPRWTSYIGTVIPRESEQPSKEIF